MPAHRRDFLKSSLAASTLVALGASSVPAFLGRSAQAARLAPSGDRVLVVVQLIGGNDGVPFTVPGYSGLVNTFADFNTPAKVPSFVQALENANLQNPGTVAHMTLKLGGLIEAPARVLLVGWPAVSFNKAWEAPITGLGNDSCVVLYWPEKVLAPGQRREVAFAYGLGGVDADDDRGRPLGAGVVAGLEGPHIEPQGIGGPALLAPRDQAHGARIEGAGHRFVEQHLGGRDPAAVGDIGRVAAGDGQHAVVRGFFLERAVGQDHRDGVGARWRHGRGRGGCAEPVELGGLGLGQQ